MIRYGINDSTFTIHGIKDYNSDTVDENNYALHHKEYRLGLIFGLVIIIYNKLKNDPNYDNLKDKLNMSLNNLIRLYNYIIKNDNDFSKYTPVSEDLLKDNFQKFSN